MVVIVKLPKTPLDEVELYLRLAQIKYSYEIKDMTNQEISQFLNKRFDINSTEQDIVLLYEPDVDDMELDLKEHFHAMNLYY